MKIAPIIREIEKRGDQGSALTYRLIHTGRHYDRNMSGSFFEQLGIPDPDHNLGAGSDTQAGLINSKANQPSSIIHSFKTNYAGNVGCHSGFKAVTVFLINQTIRFLY